MDNNTICPLGALLVLAAVGLTIAALLPGCSVAAAPGPTTEISLSGTRGNNGWFTSDVTVSLNATDASGVGINRTEHSFNGSVWARYTGPFNVTREYMNAIYFRSVDNGSTVEATKVAMVDIDKTPPTLSYALAPAPNARGWSNQTVQVTFDCLDAMSGLDSRPSDLTLTNEGVYSSLVGIAVDKAGNTASVSLPVIGIDRTPPAVGSLTLQGTTYTEAYIPVSVSLVEANPYEAEWDWGDGTGTAAILSDDVARGIHAYRQAGTYTMALNVVDLAGNAARAVASVTVLGAGPTATPAPTPIAPRPPATPTPTQVPLPSPTPTPAPAADMLLSAAALVWAAGLATRLAKGR